MKYLDSIFCPWATFLDRSEYRHSVLCLIMQMTLLGWLPASLWSMMRLIKQKKKHKHRVLHPTVEYYASSQIPH